MRLPHSQDHVIVFKGSLVLAPFAEEMAHHDAEISVTGGFFISAVAEAVVGELDAGVVSANFGEVAVTFGQ
ncbi:hypothetical protein E5D57_009663 [Metarhizium anisopliae]|nr:hypothetical protein E5D57_009663 [Metarhizium anisopliae]